MQMRRAIQKIRGLFWRGHLHLVVRKSVVASQIAQAPARSIVCFGDSRVEQALLPGEIERYQVINAGVGSATAGLLAEIIPGLLNDKRLSVSILSVGINDSKTTPTTSDNFGEKITRICDVLQDHFDRVILTTIPPVLSQAPLGIGYFDPIKIFVNNETIKRIAKNRGLSIIDLTAPMSDETGSLRSGYSIDGVHFTPEGYSVWSKAIASAVTD
jgi:lysophospholipase L1-like esterase